MITEIVVLGRGGLGGVTGAQLIAMAAYRSGNYKDVASFPTFGTERRGSPVYAYTRIADEKIWTRQQIYNPDILVVLDETVLTPEYLKNLKPGGTLVINTDKSAEEVVKKYGLSPDITVACANVTKLCLDEKLIVDGFPMVNIPILGVLSKVMDKIPMDCFREVIMEYLGPEKGSLNVKIAEKAAEITDIRRGST